LFERDGPACLEGAGELGRTGGLHPDDFDLWPERRDRGSDACDEAAPADRDQNSLHIRSVLQNFQAAGALTGDDVQALERRDHGEPLCIGNLPGPLVAFL
jgi:hypothetical protein